MKKSLVNDNVFTTNDTVEKILVVDSVPEDEPVIIKYEDDGIEYIEVVSFRELWEKIEGAVFKTERGEYIKIPERDIKIFVGKNRKGGSVFTKIRYILRHWYEGEIIRVQAVGGVVDVTPNHSLIDWNGRVFDASNVKEGQRLSFRKLQKLTVRYKGFYWNDDVAWLFGLFLAEGWINYNEYNQSFEIHVSNANEEIVERVIEIFEKEFGVKASVVWTDGAYTVTVRNAVLWKLFRKMFYDGSVDKYDCSTKKVPREIYIAPNNIKISFIKGYLDGDGRKNVLNIDYYSKSKILAQGMLVLVMSLKECENKSYNVFIHSKNGAYGVRINTGIKTLKDRGEVRKVERYWYKGWVYDVSTEDESFVSGVGSIRVHNTNIGLDHALALGRAGYETYYAIVHSSAFPKAEDEITGLGFSGIKKIWDWADGLRYGANVIVFTDSGFGGLANWLRSKGYYVFGADVWSEKLELDRRYVRSVFRRLGIPIPNGVELKGIKAVVDYIDRSDGVKFVKISRFRGCFGEGTEIFTRRGWVDFKDLRDDEVLTMNPETGEMEFVKPVSYIKYHYTGYMYKYDGKSIKFCVTPNHGFLVKKNHGEKYWKYRIGYDLFEIHKGNVFVPVSAKWNGKNYSKFILLSVECSTRKCDDKELDMEAWLQFLGWFVAEGSIEGSEKRLSNSKYRIVISQSKNVNKDKFEMICRVIDKLGFNYNIDDDRAIVIHNKQLWMWLRDNCYAEPNKVCDVCGRKYCSHKKKVPDFIKELSSDLIRVFLDTFLLGDGNVTRGERRYYTSSKWLVDDLSELIIKVGKQPRIHIDHPDRNVGGIVDGKRIVKRTESYYVSELNRKVRQIVIDNVKKVWYDGNVYDVTVEPYHTILVRYNGTVWWSGNSVETFGTDDPKEAEFLLKQGAMALFGEDVWFVVEDKLNGVEIGIDTWFNGKEFQTIVAETIEMKGSGNISKFVEYEDSVWYNVLEKIRPYLAKNGYRGMFALEGFYDGHKIYVTDVTPRFPYICSHGYPRAIKNYAELIIGTAKGELVEPVVKSKYSAQIGVYTDNPDRYAIIKFDEKYKDRIAFRKAIVQDGKVWFVPGDYVVAVATYESDNWEDAIINATEIAESVSFPSSYTQGREFLEWIKNDYEKLMELGYEF